jgi:hypothetical protein
MIIGIQLALGDINFKLGIWFLLILTIQIIFSVIFLQSKNYAQKIKIDSPAFDLSIFGTLGFFSMFLNGNQGGSAGMLVAWILVRLLWFNGGGMLFTKLSIMLASSEYRAEKLT